MGKLLNYHLVTLTPLLSILGLYIYEMIHIGLFAAFILLYTLVFRPLADKERLKQLSLYENEGFWKLFWVSRFRHYGVLMFGW